VPQIEVAFEIDANGILQVAAREKVTGREQSVRISNTGGLSETEVERLRQEAELYAEDDQRRMQLVALRNQADSILYSYETTLRDNSGYINDELKHLATQKVAELRAAIANRMITVEELQARIQALQQTLMTIGEVVYQQGHQPQQSNDYAATTQAAPWANGHMPDQTPSFVEGYDEEFIDDTTVTADYEAVD
jgi:molecular chaperone DnaK